MKRATEPETTIHHELSLLRTALGQTHKDAYTELERVGRRCREQGRHLELEAFLKGLPQKLQKDERVLYWRLSCALRAGRVESLRVEVETHLKDHEAPELRALYAGVLAPWEHAFAESERACRARRTPFTLYQVGRLHPDAEAGAAFLRESVGLAEQRGDAYEMTRNAGTLTGKLIHLGGYREAAHWGGWALSEWQLAGLRDPLRRMLLVNDLAYARLLCGESQGLSDCLSEENLESAPPEYARLYRGTLADFLLVRGDAARALVHYRANFETAPRRHLGTAALDLVRGLLEVGEGRAAREVGERAFHLTRGDPPAFHKAAQLALGIALIDAEPERAEALLDAALSGFLDPLEAHRLAQAALHLAWLELRRGDRAGARGALTRAAPGLSELSRAGFRLLFAFPEGERLWELLSSRDKDLELYLLGRAEVWLRGQRLPLRLRELEIISLLALHPQGLSLERLDGLLGEPGRGGTKTVISRLRKKLPITAAPYRLEVEVYTDVMALSQALKKGDLDEVLRLYQGELLGASSAPGVSELRSTLEARLHAAALRSRDPDALITVAERSEGDLQLWEAALELLPPQDARAPIVRARVRQLRASWER